ncbi:unnamed protein product [Aureobasidium pullulans]|nr:unnamed protein product [Aureobasidium pullulans]
MPDVEETLGTLTDVEEIPELIPVTEDTTEHASVVEVTPNIVPFARRTSKIVSVPSELPPLSCFGGTTIDLETSDGEVFTEHLLEPGFVDSLPREFLRDVVLTGHKQSLALQGTFYMPKRENCYYHVHTADEHC